MKFKPNVFILHRVRNHEFLRNDDFCSAHLKFSTGFSSKDSTTRNPWLQTKKQSKLWKLHSLKVHFQKKFTDHRELLKLLIKIRSNQREFQSTTLWRMNRLQLREFHLCSFPLIKSKSIKSKVQQLLKSPLPLKVAHLSSKVKERHLLRKKQIKFKSRYHYLWVVMVNR